MNTGDLIKFIDVCQAFILENSKRQAQISIWPETANILPGEIGVLLSQVFYEDVGCLCEVLVGNIIFFDIPLHKIKKLPATTI